MVKKYEKMKKNMCSNHLLEIRNSKKLQGNNSKTIQRNHINEDLKAVDKSKIAPVVQETVKVSPNRQKFTQVLKMTDLGAYLDQPLGFRTFRNQDQSQKQLNQDNEYITYRNNAFAPMNQAQTMAKIQSLENFFKNESL